MGLWKAVGSKCTLGSISVRRKALQKRGILILAIIASISLAIVADQTFGKGFSWQDMDWNGDGHTSFAEFFHTFDVGSREVEVNSNECREAYLLKDGTPVKLLCP
ncbi:MULTISPECIES: hypothetical protein [unclassified Mesorhizobium]|uniref:hypothetical protein n=1 Tax=unclassified Mesorhizobium TaxID=325217 RepID=UPI003337AB3A